MFVNSVADIIITKIFSANRLRNSPVGITIHRHNRNGWAVALKTNGKTIYTVDGNSILSDRLHPVILPKGCSYSWQCVEPGECILIEFDATTEAQQIFSFEIADNSFITNAFSRIEKCLHSPHVTDTLECKYVLYGVLLTLSKSIGKEYIPKDKRKTLQPAMEYITERYYDSGITNEHLSSLCGISTVYFRKTFESVYGVSPIKYLHNFRVKKAKAILRSDYESIEQVALSVGYNSIYHFSKMFKSYTGTSPTEYAKASRT